MRRAFDAARARSESLPEYARPRVTGKVPSPHMTADCLKIAYPSELAARRAMTVIRVRRNADNQRRTEGHIYQCECASWHLSSPPRSRPR